MGRVSLSREAVFATESSSHPGTFWTQKVDGSGRWSCECPDYVHRERQCKHIRERRAELSAERARLRKVLAVFARYDPHDVRERLAGLNQILGEEE